MGWKGWVGTIAAVTVLGMGTKFVFERAQNASRAVESGCIVSIRMYTYFWDKETTHYDVTIRGERYVTFERNESMDYILYDVEPDLYDKIVHGSRSAPFTIRYNDKDITVWYDEDTPVEWT